MTGFPSISIATLFTWIPILLVIEGFFSGSEIALLSADRIELRKQAKSGLFGADRALELLNHPERIFSTTLMMTSLCIIFISSLLEVYFLSHGGHSGVLSVAIASPLIVFLGELLPKTLYQKHSAKMSRWLAPPVYLTFWIFYPLTKPLSLYTHRISSIVGPIEEMITGKRKNLREEIMTLLTYGRQESAIKSSEKRMIKRIFDFKDSEAKHALIPLVKVDAIEDTALVKESLQKFETHRHSRMPVYSNRIDNIVGVLEISDLVSASDLQQPIRQFMSSPHYVAETQSLEDVLSEMRNNDIEMVVVVDEYGGAIGILTLEDIVEEIVGEISDEYDTEHLPYREISPQKAWVIQARMEIQQINDTLKLDLPQGDYETLGGFLLQQFGRIPDLRDELFFHTSTGLLKFTIQKATERHIESALVEIQKPNS